MSCPDLSALARAGTPKADPAVVEHIRNCDSCWVDWQIQQGARFLRDPQVVAADDLDERIVARAALIARHSERPANWRRLLVTGLLVGVLTFLLLQLPNDLTSPGARFPCAGVGVRRRGRGVTLLREAGQAGMW